MTRVAVVGHVEWVEFIAVPELPRAGQVLHANESFTRAAGGGGVAAVVLAELGAEVDFFCALGRDEAGEAAAAQLQDRGVNLHAAWREQATRRAVTLLDRLGERTIVTIGERLEPRGEDRLPWDRLDRAAGVFFTAGDRLALTRSRSAVVLVASPRGRGALLESEVKLDALVLSALDERERAWASEIGDRARLVVATEGADGGSWRGESQGRWAAVAPSGPSLDSYGCGDSFVAGFTFGLASGLSVVEAVQIGAERGALMLRRAGAP